MKLIESKAEYLPQGSGIEGIYKHNTTRIKEGLSAEGYYWKYSNN